MRQISTILVCLVFIWFVFTKTTTGQAVGSAITQKIPQIQQTIKELPALPQMLQPALIPSPTPTPLPIGANALLAAINTIRIDNHAQTLRQNQILCPLAQHVATTQSISLHTIVSACKYCTNVISLDLVTPVGTEAALQYIESDSTASAILNNKQMREICIATNVDYTGVVAASIVAPPSPQPIKNISEADLWQALTQYRSDHKVSTLNLDNNLCIYARKRADDQINLLNEHLPPSKYPVPDKYPLDGHDGFEKDGTSGYLFQVTGKSTVAENLAYFPDADYATHVIEWGWDQSVPHRETQLSNDYTSACVTGKNGFFVAEFGK